jgi:hypothetical protein
MGLPFGFKQPLQGMPSEFDVVPSEFLLGEHKILRGCIVDQSSRDAGNPVAPVIIRPGMALGQIAATGKFAPYNASASNGTQIGVGILYEQVHVVDNYGNATDASGIIVLHGLVDSTKVIGADAGFWADVANLLPLGVGAAGLDQA